MTRPMGALAVALTADQGRHEKSRQRSGRRLMVDMDKSFNCTLPTVGAVGRAEHRAVARPMPVASFDDGPPLGERQVAREHPFS